ASRDLVQQSLLDAVGAARRAADELFARLTRRLEAEPGPTPVLRLTDEFARDDVWPQGLDVALDNLLLAFSRLRDGVETIADRLSLDDPSERRAPPVGGPRGVGGRPGAGGGGAPRRAGPPAGGPPGGGAVGGTRRGRRARAGGAGARVGRRHVRAVHEPRRPAPRRRRGARPAGRPLAAAGSGRRPARPAAAAVPRGGLRHLARHRFVLGGRRR